MLRADLRSAILRRADLSGALMTPISEALRPLCGPIAHCLLNEQVLPFQMSSCRGRAFGEPTSLVRAAHLPRYNPP